VGRHVGANFCQRKSQARILSQLKSTPPSGWPPQLNKAWIILHKEMRLRSSESLSVIFDSVSAAQKYLREENRQVKIIEEFEARGKIKRLFFRISKCTSRAPVAIRGRLDARVHPIIKESVIDLETIESIFDAIRSIFDEFPEFEASRVALKSIDNICRADFSLLGISFQKDLEEAIKKIVNTETEVVPLPETGG
jgi:hypothetical protein